APVPHLLRSRPIVMAGIIAVSASLSAALVTAIYPVYFTQVGFGEALIGGLRSVNAVGIVVVAFSFGTIVAFMGQRRLIAVSLVLTGVFTIATTVAGSAVWAAALVILVVGATFGILRAVYPAIAAGNSLPGQRGVAMSVAALYWALGQLFVPLIFGFIAEYLGASEALWIGGGLLIGLGIASPVLYNWLLAPSINASKAADAASQS
ncbi:MAG: MFS transporter, partial [Chloroflexi bacterium]|nr:MFS transporter [Chloroflexota bacterium]